MHGALARPIKEERLGNAGDAGAAIKCAGLVEERGERQRDHVAQIRLGLVALGQRGDAQEHHAAALLQRDPLEDGELALARAAPFTPQVHNDRRATQVADDLRELLRGIALRGI